MVLRAGVVQDRQIVHSSSVGSGTSARRANARSLRCGRISSSPSRRRSSAAYRGGSSFAQVREYLPDLGAAKQVLLGRLQERHQRFRSTDEYAGEGVVEEALVAECVAAAVAGEHPFGRELVYVVSGERVQCFAAHRELLGARHLVGKGLDDPHPVVVGRWRDALRHRPSLGIPVPVEDLGGGAERRRAGGIELGVEKQGQVLWKLQDLQLTFREACGVETRGGQNLLDLVDRELGDVDPGRLCFGIGRHESAQTGVVLPIEFPADDHGVQHGPGTRPARLAEKLFDEIEDAGVSAGHGAHGIELIDDQHARKAGRLGRGGEHQGRRFFEIENAAEIRGGRCRGETIEAIEPERQDRDALLAEGIDDLDDTSGLAGAGLSRQDAVGRGSSRCSQALQQRLRGLARDERCCRMSRRRAPPR